MTDEAPDQVQDTPDDAAPEEGHAAPDPYEQRYNDLRSEFDRRNEELKELREFQQNLADPDRQADVLRRFGIELDAEEDFDLDPVDPAEELRQEVASLKQELSGMKEQGQQAQRLAEIERHVDDELDRIDPDQQLSDDEVELIASLAASMLDENGMPDVQAAHDRLFNKFLESKKESWVSTKRAPRAPKGPGASKQPDLTIREDRREHMAAQLAARGD